MRPPRVAYVVTHPTSARVLLRGQLAQMRAWGFDVAVFAAPGPELDQVAEREKVEVFGVPMEREIAPSADARSLPRLTRALHRWRPDIVNASTPKGGLLGMLAARALNVPVRIYLLRGLRLETSRGATRRILGITERIASACATRVICVSESLRRVYVDSGYARAWKTAVLAGGSSNGVDIDRWVVNDSLRARAAEIKGRLAIPEDAIVFGFVGRLVEDKGIVELLDAFDAVRAKGLSARLLLIGDNLAGDSISPSLRQRVMRSDGVVTAGQVEDPAPYYAAMDLLAFPSLREGFPNVPLEAASAGLPVAGFRVTGVLDAVQDGETGLLVERGDVQALSNALTRYSGDSELRKKHGQAGQARARRLFARSAVWRAWAEEYVRELRAHGLPEPIAFSGRAGR